MEPVVTGNETVVTVVTVVTDSYDANVYFASIFSPAKHFHPGQSPQPAGAGWPVECVVLASSLVMSRSWLRR